MSNTTSSVFAFAATETVINQPEYFSVGARKAIKEGRLDLFGRPILERKPFSKLTKAEIESYFYTFDDKLYTTAEANATIAQWTKPNDCWHVQPGDIRKAFYKKVNGGWKCRLIIRKTRQDYIDSVMMGRPDM